MQTAACPSMNRLGGLPKAPPLVAYLRLQPLIPLCIAAADAWRQKTGAEPCVLEIPDVTGEKNQVWADAGALQTALLDAIETVARSTSRNDRMVLTVSPAGGLWCRVAITCRKTGPEKNSPIDSSALDLFQEMLSRAKDIVAKHGGALDLVNNGAQGLKIDLCLPGAN